MESMPMPDPDPTTMSMHMSLYWGRDAVVLFPRWPGQSLGMYVLALFFVFLLATGTELLSILPAFRPAVARSAAALSQAAVYALRMGLAYLIMLAVMSFNIGILVAAVVGHGIGFFVVRWRLPADGGGGARDMGSGCAVTTDKV